jgi:hypothetical protein
VATETADYLDVLSRFACETRFDDIPDPVLALPLARARVFGKAGSLKTGMKKLIFQYLIPFVHFYIAIPATNLEISISFVSFLQQSCADD